MNELPVLDHGYVKLLNISGPFHHGKPYNVDDTDPANTARMSFDQTGTKTRAEDLKLVDYLITHSHTTPVEMIQVWLEMKLPIFVARQFVRHRTVSINEVSARYTKLPNEYYLPALSSITTKSPSNKQGRSSDPHPDALAFQTSLDLICKRAYLDYQYFLERGVAPELCRTLLPVNFYTKWIWRQDLHNLLHFISLRKDHHAQWEAQQYALAIEKLLSFHVPHIISLHQRKP